MTATHFDNAAAKYTNNDTAIVQINIAELALSRANDIHEMIELRSYGAAAEMLANARGFKDAAQQAKIFQLKAERKAGTWLAENVKPGNPQLFQDGINSKLPEGIDSHESHRWQIEASLPEEKFNEWIDESLARGWEISAGGLRRIAQNHLGKVTGNHYWPECPYCRTLLSQADGLLFYCDSEDCTGAIE